MANTLYFGDNLHVLREYVKDESVDLIYLDPPFNSNADYGAFFRAPGGEKSKAQADAFIDIWRWSGEAPLAYDEVVATGSKAAGILVALRQFLGTGDTLAYLSMMAVRLIEMRRVLKPTGTLYLHCDPTASHYIKLLLDAIFGPERFMNEVIWKRSTAKGHARNRFASAHDTLLVYAKGPSNTWNKLFQPHADTYLKSHYSHIDDDGRRYTLGDCLNPNRDRPNLTYEWNGHTRVWRWTRDKMQGLHDSGRLVYTRSGMPRYKRYLDEMAGTPITSVWSDIPPINSQAQERLGWPTQKPLALLRRIINASSNPGDTILDPFCGCGTAVHAAQELGRHWVGIDVTHIAIQIILDRLKQHFPAQMPPAVLGLPRDAAGACALAERDKYQFQWWAAALVGAQPRGGRKRGADGGIDGEVFFKLAADRDGRAVVSVKASRVLTPGMVRDLVGTRKNSGADMALFISLNEPTEAMRETAADDGFITTAFGRFPRTQVVSIGELLDGRFPLLPPRYNTATAAVAAARASQKAVRKPRPPIPSQTELLLPLPGGKIDHASVYQLDIRYDQPDQEYPMAAEEAAPTPTPPKKRRKAG